MAADKWIEAAAVELYAKQYAPGSPGLARLSMAAIIQRHYDAWLGAQQPGAELDQRVAAYLDAKLPKAGGTGKVVA